MIQLNEMLMKRIHAFFGSREPVAPELWAFLETVSEDYTLLSRKAAGAEERALWFELFEQNISDSIWLLGMDMKFRYVSPSSGAITGYTPEEYMSMGIENIMTPESYREAVIRLRRELENEKEGVCEPDRVIMGDFEMYCKNGGTVWIEARIKFLRQEGKITGILGVTRDVTDQHFAEKALRESEARFRSVFLSIEDGYYEVDLDGQYIFFNDSFCKILGYSAEELTGMSYRRIVVPEGHDHLFRLYKEVYFNEAPQQIVIEKFIRKDGSIRYGEGSVALRYGREGDKIGFCGIIRDVTGKIMIEDELRQRNEIIEHDMKTAQLIQRSLVSGEPPELDWIRSGYRYLPLDAVGGDYFSFIPLREGGMGLFIGDVSSHGVTAALFLALVKAAAERICRVHALSPLEFITELNSDLFGNMPMSFLTAAYGVFSQAQEGCVDFTFSSAGHPHPIVYRADAGIAEYVPCKGPLIGMFKHLEFHQETISLKKGDRMFFYTDGIPETMNEKKEMIGFDSLPRVLSRCNCETLENTLDNIIDGINVFRGEAPLNDDIVLLGFEVL